MGQILPHGEHHGVHGRYARPTWTLGCAVDTATVVFLWCQGQVPRTGVVAVTSHVDANAARPGRMGETAALNRIGRRTGWQELPGQGRPAAVARSSLRAVLGRWGVCGDLAGCAELVVSELATNALRHSRGRVSLRLGMDACTGHLFIAVRDGDPRPVHSGGCAAADGDESGRGLAIVAALAVRHGCTPARDHKVMWAVLAPHQPDEPPQSRAER
jgi:anti-sigma regulatory factor (Ser/Thr protein kinase)